MNTKELAAFITATGTAVAAGFVAFGHPDLSTPASTAFISVAGLIVALVHSKLLGGSSATPAATTYGSQSAPTTKPAA